MSNKVKSVVIALCTLLAAMSVPEGNVSAAPPELVELRKSYLVERIGASTEDQKKEVEDQYIEDLTSLVINMRGMRRENKDVNAVRKEIRKVQSGEDAGLAEKKAPPTPAVPDPVEQRVAEPEAAPVVAVAPPPTPKPAPNPMAAAPAPKPVVAMAEPKSEPKPAVVMLVPAPKPAPNVVAPKPTPKPAPQPTPKPAPKVEVKPAPTPKPKPVVAKPAPKPKPKPAVAKPAVAKRDPKTQVSSTQGMASAGDFSKNNVYTFDLAESGSVVTVKYWINGRFGIDSTGTVWLVLPDGSRENIGNWREGASSSISTGVTSYKELEPVSVNISKKAAGPGVYKIEFEWNEGSGPLYIYRVEFIS